MVLPCGVGLPHCQPDWLTCTAAPACVGTQTSAPAASSGRTKPFLITENLPNERRFGACSVKRTPQRVAARFLNESAVSYAGAFACAAWTGGGVTSAAEITRTNANAWTAIPSVSPGIGSPNTTIPPRMQDTLAAVDVAAITGTASPSRRRRADAKKATTEAIPVTASQGEPMISKIPPAPVSALMAT